jgi:hypothetical protein
MRTGYPDQDRFKTKNTQIPDVPGITLWGSSWLVTRRLGRSYRRILWNGLPGPALVGLASTQAVIGRAVGPEVGSTLQGLVVHGLRGRFQAGWLALRILIHFNFHCRKLYVPQEDAFDMVMVEWACLIFVL